MTLLAVVCLGPGCRPPRNVSQVAVRSGADANEFAAALAERISPLLPSEEAAAAIAVVENGEVSFAIAGNPAITEDSLFEFGSITKVATANLVAQLVLEGALDLDATLDVLLEGDGLGEAWSETTPRQLLTHSSGLAAWPPNLGPVRVVATGKLGDPFGGYDADDLVEGMRDQRRPTPGVEWVYSNYGFAILGRILERETGVDYDTLVEERFLGSIGTKAATLHGWSGDDVARPLSRRGRETTNWTFEAFAPAGALRGTLEDGIVLLTHAMTACDRDDQVAQATCRAQQSQDFRMNETSEVGLAWIRSSRSGDVVVWHNGGTGGYSTFLGFTENARRGVIVLTNVGFFREIDDLAMQAITTGLGAESAASR